MHKAFAEYEKALELANGGDQHNAGPWSVAQAVPYIIFKAWVEQVAGVWKVAYVTQSAEVLLYGDPSAPHARTIGWFLMQIAEQIRDQFGRGASKMFDYSTGETISLPSFGYKSPFCQFWLQKSILPFLVQIHHKQLWWEKSGITANATFKQCKQKLICGIKLYTRS